MNISDRKQAYKEYLAILDDTKGALTEKAIQALNDAFDITQEDLDNDVNELIKNPENTPMAAQAARFRILMEDLRDYRDSTEIKKSRRAVIKDIYSDESIHTNEKYIFPI